MSGEKKGTRFLHLTQLVVMGFVMTHAGVAAGASWPHTWGGPANDYGVAVAFDSARNVYIAGATSSFGAGGQDVLILKYDPTGTLQWAKTWGGAGDEYATSIAIGPDGFLYVTGGTDSFGAGWYDMFLLKLDTNGNLGVPGTWAETWGGSSYDVGHDLGFDASGNIYLVGETYSYPLGGGSASILMKFSPSGGAPLWTATWKGPATYDTALSLTVDLDGNVVISGISWDYSVYPLHNSILLIKYGPSGNRLWSENWTSPFPSQDESWSFRGLTTDAQRNIYVGGHHAAQCATFDFPACNFDTLALKVDSGGGFQWANTWGSAGFDMAGSLAIDPSGNLLVSGMEDLFGQTPAASVSAFGTDGSPVSATVWGGQAPGNPEAGIPGGGIGMMLDSLGNAFIAGAALNNTGGWLPTSLSVTSLPNYLVSNPFSVGAPVGQQSVLTNPTQLQTGGVADTGGGGADAFVAKISSGGGAPLPGMGNDPTTASCFLSEPVNTGNGNYVSQHTDITIPGRGMPIVFQRSYNALDNYSGPLGANWTHSYNIFAIQTFNGVVIKWGDGHGETYTLSGGMYVPQPGVFSTLVQNPGGTYVLTQKNETRYLFSATGSLTSIINKNGNTIVLTYTGGNLTQITDTVGRNLSLAYDGSNRIIKVTDPIGRAVSFSYSATNDLAQVTDPAGGVTQYTYDASHHVASITLPNGQTLLQNTYDSAGRVASQTNGRGFTATFAYGTPSPGQTTITDARGNQTVHTYDASLRITTITDALGGLVGYAYDANNDRTGVTNQNGKSTAFAYDGDGNLTAITDPLGNSSAFTYDTKNDLLTATNPKGKTTTFSYDSNGNLKTIQDTMGDTTTFAYGGSGQLTAKTDANGHTTTYGYDSFGNLSQITDALGDVTTLGYDGIGRLTTLTDPNHHAATAAYDSLSRLTTVTDPLGHATRFAYDAVGNLLKITDANGNATTYAYDAVNNLVTVTDALGHITHYAYDPNNNRTTFTNAKGNATAYAFDNLNRLSAVTDPLSFVSSYAYDPVGNVTAVKDANGKTNQFAYDALNRLIGISYADGKSVAYAYDADGNRTTMVDSHGTTVYNYDALDRLATVTNPGGGTVAYGHDAVGNRNSLTYPDGKLVNYAYDAGNRLTGVSDWLGRMTGYSYDAASNLLAIAYPNKASMAFAYDAANRLTSIANAMPGVPPIVIGYGLDAVGNRIKEIVNGIATAFGYDPLNELASAQLGPLKTAWTYDAVGNRVKQTSPLGPTAYAYDAGDRLVTAGSTAFAYDNNGNRITETSGRLSWAYSYDAANRLIKALGNGMNSTFGYDGDGNRTAQTNGTGIYNYLNDVASALPVVLNEQGPDGNITYAYGLGLIEESNPKFNYFYHYDGLGSVIALTDATGRPQAAYAYDPWGNTLLTVTNSVGTKNKFLFTGEALDPGTGLYYLRARYYDATVGRFIEKDPVRAGANRFSYVYSNPIRYTDPSGLTPAETSQPENEHLMAAISVNPPTALGTLLGQAGSAALSLLVNFVAEGTADFPLFGVAVGLYQAKGGLSATSQNMKESQDAPIDVLASHLKDGTTTVDSLIKQIQGQSGYGLGKGYTYDELKSKIIQSAERQGIVPTQEQIDKKEVGIFGN